jgi:zinc transport system substrate-binding protein
VELTLLLDDGVDPHSYQPTADDMIAVSRCDLLVCVGGVSERWVADALQEAVVPDKEVVDMLELLGGAVREEEHTEGMEAEEEEHDAAVEYDEHVWLSLQCAATVCGAIADALCGLDPAHAETYRQNAGQYADALRALDARYRRAVDAAQYKTLLFGDRFPFRYLTEDYGLTYYAAFPGCAAETEASFETILFLANKLETLGLPCVLTIEGSQHRIAETIVENTRTRDQQILVLDSIQSTTAAEITAGATYLGAMEANLDVLRQALGTRAGA